ncbi:neutral and basic amino acid transport protein rBAT-like [Asterias rubens]|uniref:neutral and basic amino acid transport protein rBAT-like n=1 Tax=Asterias rubens TaxID=7604 RepID=UPI001455C18D|nr:neutral and basic amino acid transport protein rBAT-like [Asterias rubens]
MADFGYDVADFKDIDPIFGTIADFDDLIDTAHNLGLKLMMDFVPNHSSEEHEWFLRSKENNDTNNPYRDYYVWKDPKIGCNDQPEKCVPNNWVSVFGGSVWEWEPKRKQFYLHQFLKEQPDLNYNNPLVHREMEEVIKFWFEKGVDGLRVDAIRHMYEDKDMEDEPINPEYTPVPGERPQYDSLIHTKTADLPELHDVIKDWRAIFEDFSSEPNYRFMVTESYDTHRALLPYYGTPNQPEADYPFNFGLTELTNETLSGKEIHNKVQDWMKDLPEGKWPNWVIGNHDTARITERLGMKYARAMNILNLLLPGTPTTYYGEEIAMEGIWVPYNETQDPYAINNPNHWEEYTRDPERSPMQWDDTPHAGFSTTNGKTWLPVNDNYLTGVNVADQIINQTSPLALFKTLANLRKTESSFQTNHLKYAIVNEQIFSFFRLSGDSTLLSFLVIVNTGDSPSTDDYQTALMNDDFVVHDSGVIEVSSGMDRNGASVELNKISVASGEALVVKVQVSFGNEASVTMPRIIVIAIMAMMGVIVQDI